MEEPEVKGVLVKDADERAAERRESEENTELWRVWARSTIG